MLQCSVTYIELSDLQRDASLQARVALDLGVVREYAERMRAGATFPPVLVFAGPDGHWLADGYHRVSARESCRQTTVLAEIRQGGRDAALWASCAANKAHGLRRSNADKRRSVLRALSHPRAQRLSDRQLAQHCGVHHDTVGRVRHELEKEGRLSEVHEREVARGNSVYRQVIGGIARANARRTSSRRAESARDDVARDGPNDAATATPEPIAQLLARADTLLAEAEGHLKRKHLATPAQLPDLQALAGRLTTVRDELVSMLEAFRTFANCSNGWRVLTLGRDDVATHHHVDVVPS